MQELIYFANGKDYAQCKKEILEKWPEAKIEDASDYIHEYRFEVKLPDGVDDNEFYMFAIREGFADLCLGFGLMMRGKKEETDRIRLWILKLQKEKEEANEMSRVQD